VAGVPWSETWTTRFTEGQLLRRDGECLVLDDDLLDDIEQVARRQGRWEAHHAACAQMLFERYAARHAGVARRRADHLERAGKYEEALEPLLLAEEEAFLDGDADEAHRLLDRRERLLDHLGADARDPRRAQNTRRRAELVYNNGDVVGAQRLIEECREILVQDEWPSEQGNAAQLYGRILRDTGRQDEARRCFEEAMTSFGASGDDRGLATSRASLAYLELAAGRHDSAKGYFTKALQTFRTLGDDFMISSILLLLATIWRSSGDIERAKETVAEALEASRRSSHKPIQASALITLGEIARSEDKFDAAKQHYARAAAILEAAELRTVHIARYNISLVEIGAGHFSEARSILTELLERYPAVGFDARLPLVYAGLMTCAIGEGDWSGFEKLHATTLEMVDESDAAHADLAWMAQRALELVDARERPVAHQQMVDFACEQLERLDRDDEANELRDRQVTSV
jgi:tetratricopeptide (TPR) repeat protein